MFKDIDLSGFPPEREEKLKNIYRYSFFDVAMYRSNLWRHNIRVLWMLEEIIPLAQKYIQFDAEKARTYALVHDDVEIVTGDIQAIVKSRMTEKEKLELEAKEKLAIDGLVDLYPKKVNGYIYEALLRETIEKNSIESQLVSYVDKLDAFCEALHEVYAGNISFIRAIVFYSMILPTFSSKYPALKDLLLSKEHPFVYLADQISPFKIESKNYINLNKPYTKDSVQLNNDLPFYKKWKDIIISKGKINWLIEQREYLLK